MGKPRKHHYVPQTYLKNFCNPDKRNFIYVYDKRENRKFSANIKDIAEERDFYKIVDKKDEYYWEKFYSKNIESSYPNVLGTLIAICNVSVNNAVILNTELKKKLSYLICVQLLRTKKAREQVLATSKSAGEETVNALKKELPRYLSAEQREWLDKFQITEELLKSIDLEIINNRDRLTKFSMYMIDKTWIVYYNNISEKNPFITSDHPVCYYNMISKSTDFKENGLSVPATSIFFPVSTKILVCLYNKKLFWGNMKCYDGQKIEIDEEKFIKFINGIQLQQCYRQCYSSI